MTKQIQMGQNTIGTIVKSMAYCPMTNKKIMNHSMTETLVAKVKKFGQLRDNSQILFSVTHDIIICIIYVTAFVVTGLNEY